jgi:hypothetical protein
MEADVTAALVGRGLQAAAYPSSIADSLSLSAVSLLFRKLQKPRF